MIKTTFPKCVERFIASIIAISFILNGIIISSSSAASARRNYTVEEGYYRIYHPESKKYLDISEVSTKNGARAHLWQKAEGYQNQIFYLSFNNNGTYTLTANHSHKCIEVRNSNTEDYGEVSQWDYAGIPCQQWYISRNNDSTYSFRNANSGLNLNVEGNGHDNGTKFIQYHSDGTTAEKFKLIKLNDSDIISAEWKSDLTDIPLNSIDAWGNDVCKTEFYYEKDLRYYFPSTTSSSMVRVSYINSDLLVDMITDAAFKDTLKKKIKDKSKEKAIDCIKGYLDSIKLPVVGHAYDIAEFLYTITSSENDAWNEFVSVGTPLIKQGKGIVIKEYTQTYAVTAWGQLRGPTPSYGTYMIYKDKKTFDYSEWNERLISDVNQSGEWTYTYK